MSDSRKIISTTSETRRYLIYLVCFSIFLVLFSCFSILRTSNSDSTLPESVLKFMLPNNTSISSTKTSSAIIMKKSSLNSSASTPSVIQNNPVPELRTAVVNKNEKYCDPNGALLKVYMYDLLPEFHFGLLGWSGKKNQMWPDVGNLNNLPTYPGGLNLQHSVEYWLTLDILSSHDPRVHRPCTAVRVENSSIADLFFVPFFASLSYNRHSNIIGKEKVSKNKYLQDELVKFLKSREEWKRSGGKDHLIVAHHPNSLLDARKKLGSAMLVLSDFGRYSVEIANLGKDIIAPYRHVVPSVVTSDSASFDHRSTLAYFQGAIHRKDGGLIRQQLYQLLKDEKDVHFSYGNAQKGGIRRASRGMASSKYCLNIAGDTPSSNRLFDAIVSLCVPVIISDKIELPFEDVLDYSEFCIFVRASDAVRKGFLLNLLRGIPKVEWTKMWEILKKISHHFEYQYPSKEGDTVQMIWEAAARKVPMVQLKINRDNRFRWSQRRSYRN